MHLKLVRSGGLAGLNMVATLDSADLPAEQQDLLATLLTGSPKPARSSEGQTGAADRFSYQLEIRYGERTVRHQWAEPDVPETVRPLLSALVNEARAAR